MTDNNEGFEAPKGWDQFEQRTASSRGKKEPCPICKQKVTEGQKYYDCPRAPVHCGCSTIMSVDKVSFPKQKVKKAKKKETPPAPAPEPGPELEIEEQAEIQAQGEELEIVPDVLGQLILKLPDLDYGWSEEMQQRWFSAYDKLLQVAGGVK